MCHYGEIIITLNVFCQVRETFGLDCALAAVLPLQSSDVCVWENQHISSCECIFCFKLCLFVCVVVEDITWLRCEGDRLF